MKANADRLIPENDGDKMYLSTMVIDHLMKLEPNLPRSVRCDCSDEGVITVHRSRHIVTAAGEIRGVPAEASTDSSAIPDSANAAATPAPSEICYGAMSAAIPGTSSSAVPTMTTTVDAACPAEVVGPVRVGTPCQGCAADFGLVAAVTSPPPELRDLLLCAACQAALQAGRAPGGGETEADAWWIRPLVRAEEALEAARQYLQLPNASAAELMRGLMETIQRDAVCYAFEGWGMSDSECRERLHRRLLYVRLVDCGLLSREQACEISAAVDAKFAPEWEEFAHPPAHQRGRLGPA